MEPFFSTLDEAVSHREELRREGKTAVLTNGCFDWLHPGHVLLLESLAKLGSELWIALNDDDSVRQLKGPSRPLIPANWRAYELRALRCVSGVFLFSGLRCDREILAFRPDVYGRAGDRSPEELDPLEMRALKSVGGRLEWAPFLPSFSPNGAGLSTTSLLERRASTIKDWKSGNEGIK